MAMFELHTVDKNDNSVILKYDTSNNTLMHEDGRKLLLPSQRFINARFGRPPTRDAIKFNNTDTPVVRNKTGVFNDVRIFLGAKCNYTCVYCYQDDVREQEESFTLESVDKFFENIHHWYAGRGANYMDQNQQPALVTDGFGTHFQFWGGEPLVYWKIIKKLVEGIHERYPRATMGFVTNGSLLNMEHVEFIRKYNLGVSMSHDGPGQKYRGQDPFENAETMYAIRELRKEGRISFSPTVHADNFDKKKIIEFFTERFGEIRSLGEGDFVEIFNPEHEAQLPLAINDSHHAHAIARKSIEDMFKYPEIYNTFSILQSRVNTFLQAIYFNRPIESLQDKCGTTSPNRMVINHAGDMLLCHHGTREGSVSECGSHTNVKDIVSNKIFSARHWSYDEKCGKCPVITICQGNCPFTVGEAHDVNCASTFYDIVSSFAFAINMLTGLRLDFIKGPHTEQFPDREDPFGLRDNQHNKIIFRKKTIPIKAI